MIAIYGLVVIFTTICAICLILAAIFKLTRQVEKIFWDGMAFGFITLIVMIVVSLIGLFVWTSFYNVFEVFY